MLFTLPILAGITAVLALGFLGFAGINYLFPKASSSRRD